MYNDNRIENLQILCPNCAATLDTHCGKNRIRINKAKIKKCETKKEREENGGRTLAEIKRSNERRKAERPPIEQLKKEVEELGYCAVGRKYNVSDNAIRKWIKK